VLTDLGNGFFGGAHADFRVSPGPEALGHLNAELDPPVGLGEGELLGVRVGDDELDAFQPGFDHVVDRVAARSADAEHDNARLQLGGSRCRKCNSHRTSRVLRLTSKDPQRPAR